MNPGTIIIAAHNEESVLGRTLDALAELREDDSVRIIVVCNGCTDGTAALAASRTGVQVVELAAASKVGALREGDRHAGPGPRIYLDADIVLTSRAARDVIHALSTGSLAGRPAQRFDTRRAGWAVRRWYRIRHALPSISSALWGAGCYALSERGRQRFGEFPDLVSDDLFVDSLFSPEEVTIVDTDPVVVTAPRRLADLLRILRRSYRTQREVSDRNDGLSEGQRGQLADIRVLLRREPALIIDVFVYVVVIGCARFSARTSRSAQRWERDRSSRELG